MKCKKKPVIYDAVQYTTGMEDGFESCGSTTCGIFNRFDRECSTCKSATPYLITMYGIQPVKEGDYILTSPQGERHLCRGDLFAKHYELV